MSKVYKIQGMEFKLKPTTPNNIRRMKEHGLQEMDKSFEKDPNDFSAYLHLLRFTTDPVSGDIKDFDTIDIDDLDIRLVEEIAADFMPRLMRISAMLMS